MSQTKKLVMLAGLAGSVLAAPALAQNTTDQQRATGAQIAADSAQRSSFLSGAQDGAVNIGVLSQFRYYINSRDEAPTGDEDATIGFQFAQNEFRFSGSVNEDFSYVAHVDVGTGGAFTLEDAYGVYALEDGWLLLFGNLRVPVMREDMVADEYQLAVDRSLTHEQAFDADWTQGIALHNSWDAWRMWFVFDDGAGTRNTAFNSTGEADFGLTARAEWKWAGDWAQFNDFTSFQGSEYAGMLGAAVHYQSGGSTGGPTADMDLTQFTIDASAEGNGWNAFISLVGRHIEPDVGDDVDTAGLVLQGGYFFNEQFEAFARYDSFSPDSDFANDDLFNTITVGANYYFIPESHAAKFTADVQYFLTSQADTDLAVSGGGFGTNTNAGLLSDTGDGQFNLRLQMQLLF